MSQTENTPDLGAMISQLLADPQRMQQLGQMAASLGLGAPAQSSSNETASCGGLPDLSVLLGADVYKRQLTPFPIHGWEASSTKATSTWSKKHRACSGWSISWATFTDGCLRCV